jgi:NAD(P)H dehydrogenase (quinone)
MRILIVHAHHEPSSFNGSMTREARAALLAAGHEAIVSDLYSMRFDPVSDRRNFTSCWNPEILKQQDEESLASRVNGYVPQLQDEMDKLACCDALILQFPLWWFGMPAILKGWVDRVFAVGRAYGSRRWFDRGVFSGKLAMCSVTVGGFEDIYSEQGINGPLVAILYPIHHGILVFTGFAVVEPFIVYGPSRISEQAREACLLRYLERVLSLPAAPRLTTPSTADYDEGLIRRTSVASER